MYKTGLREEAKSHEALSGVPNNYEIARLEGANPQLAIVYGTPSTNSTTTLYASFYDIKNGVWSGGITLSENQGHIRAFSPIFTEDGKLSVVYAQAEVIKQVVEEAEFMLPSDKVDLMILNYTPVNDLALDERMGLELKPAIPIKGTVTTVSAVVKNLGDFAEYATLYLYDGDPSLGRLIGEATTSEPIPARSTAELEVEWLVGVEERDSYHLYAVVRSDDGIADIDESNNILDHKIVTADIAITDLQWENTAGNDYLVKATVTNIGNKKLEDITVQLVHKDREKVLERKGIDLIMPGQKIDLYFLFSSNGLAAGDEYGGISMILQAFLADSIEEFSSENNSYGFVLEPTYIMVEKMEPAPNELQANIEKPLTISFNMSVEKGAEFEQIEFMDGELNLIEIDKTLEGKVLSITPQYALENGTGYTLTIPDNAVSDSYGHKMDGTYSLSFTTTSREPEIVFAYPGQGMEEIALDTEIKVRFNQDITKGPTFNNITLCTSNATKIPISLTIAGEWLHINYAGLLSANRTYFLTVPGGAVQNYKEDMHQQDYVLVFMTGDDGKSDDPGGDGGNSGGNNDDFYKEDRDEDGYNNIQVVIGGALQRLDARIDSSRVIINLRNLAKEIFSGDENVVINMPQISNVDAYTLEIDVESLTGENDNGTLTLNTSIGSLTIPAGMLSNMKELPGKIAEITIAVGDRTKISQDARAIIGNRPLIQLDLSIDGQQREWNNPTRSVRVSIPYALIEPEIETRESLVIWYIDGSGNIICIPNGHYDLSSGTVTFITNHFSYYAVGYNKVNFNDVEETAWYNKAISFIAARKITSGTGDGNFSPELKLTRGQFIVMLMKSYDIAPDINAKVNFTDAGNTYYTNYLAAAKRLGISAGVGNNMFAPEKEITRQELFTLLHNGLKVIDKLPRGNSGKNLSNFNDAGEIALWAKDAMTLFVEAGIVGGSKGKLSPLSTATRAEMAGVLYKLLSK